MQLWIKIILFAVSWLVAFSLFAFYMSIHPKKIVTNLDPGDLGLEYEEINFKSADGVRLNGWFIPHDKGKATIIIMHGYPADKANLLGIAEFLRKDFNVFLFDFRSFGKSEGAYTTAGYLEKDDLIGAIGYLEKEKNITNIGLYGFSMGGAVALTTNHRNIKAIVTDSSYARLTHMVQHMYRIFWIFRYPLAFLTKIYGLFFLRADLDNAAPVESIGDIKVPILLIHAEKDSQIPVDEAYLLKKANDDAEVWIVKGADHGMTHAINPQEYEEKVSKFYKKSIK